MPLASCQAPRPKRRIDAKGILPRSSDQNACRIEQMFACERHAATDLWMLREKERPLNQATFRTAVAAHNGSEDQRAGHAPIGPTAYPKLLVKSISPGC